MNTTERTDRANALAHAVTLATTGQLPAAAVVDHAERFRAFLAGERSAGQFPAADVDRAALERRTGPGECGDQRATHGEALAPAICTLQPGHTVQHSGGGYRWDVLPDPAPAARHCGSIKYWQHDAEGLPARKGDLRAVCTLPPGHLKDYPTHEGPDQSGATRAWSRNADCGASFEDLRCDLQAGHTGSHCHHWQNALQPR